MNWTGYLKQIPKDEQPESLLVKRGDDMDDAQMITIVKNVVEQHGCKLVDIDFENYTLNIDGPEEAQAACAKALADVLDG